MTNRSSAKTKEFPVSNKRGKAIFFARFVSFYFFLQMARNKTR